MNEINFNRSSIIHNNIIKRLVGLSVCNKEVRGSTLDSFFHTYYFRYYITYIYIIKIALEINAYD